MSIQLWQEIEALMINLVLFGNVGVEHVPETKKSLRIDAYFPKKKLLRDPDSEHVRVPKKLGMGSIVPPFSQWIGFSMRRIKKTEKSHRVFPMVFLMVSCTWVCLKIVYP